MPIPRTLFAVLLINLFAANAPAATDYLTPTLRTEVEALKAAWRIAPTDNASYATRATTAWAWLNAYAMTGRSIPVNMTTAVRPVAPARLNRGATAGLDYFIDELILMDEDPGALGELTADLGPYESRSFSTIRQQYRVGTRSILPGGGFIIARHFMPGYGEYQVDDPAGDNFVSISSDDPAVSLVPDEMPVSGMHGGFRGAQPALMFRVQAGTLKSGAVVTVIYGDTARGGRGLRMGPASTDFLPIPIYVVFAGSDHAYALPIQPIRVTGTDIAGVHGFAPSVVRPGEAFDLSVRAEDRYYNRAKGPIPAFQLMLNGKPFRRVPASPDAITVLKGITLDEPGVYRINIASDDGRIRGVANPIRVSSDASKLYWGDTHGHSGFAEGIGTPDRFMQWAKDDARLDFVVHSEHDIWVDDFEWQVLTNNVSKYSEENRFVAYLGYEWTTTNVYGGHHNVLYRDISERIRIPVQLYPTLSKLYQGLRAHYDPKDVLVIPHAHQAGDYRQSDPELEQLVEIMSHHGTFEWFGRMYLNHGHEVGFIAASDDHLSQPGYTGPWAGYMAQRGGLAAVRAPGPSRDQIFDAMKTLNTYATTGDKIILDVSLNGANMGQRTKFSTDRVISGRVIGTAPIDSITVVKNDVEVWNRDYLTLTEGKYSPEETFYISFDSPSFPMHPNDNPRGSRGWLGTVEITGADIVAFEATDFFNPDTNRLERDASKPGMLHFVTGSRGDASSIKLRLRNIKKNATAVFNLEPALERGSPTRFRPPRTTPAGTVTLAFTNLNRGQTEAIIPFDVYNDRILLRRAVETGPDDVSFEFEDSGTLEGDYYYVRVKQANDAMAWSSPIWVGGFPKQ